MEKEENRNEIIEKELNEEEKIVLTNGKKVIEEDKKLLIELSQH